LVRKAGAERVSAEAVEKLREVLEDYAISVAKKAVDIAKHAGRKTVKVDDIKLAVEMAK
jgi:histone H3/H4